MSLKKALKKKAINFSMLSDLVDYGFEVWT